MKVWALSDAAAGNRRQADALAARLGDVSRTITIESRAPWRWLAPRGLSFAARGLGDAFAAALNEPLPDLAVGCGRQAALATRVLRTLGVPVVQVLAPRIATRHWDLIVTPRHDQARGENVIETVGSLHAVDDAWLATARDAWPQLADLPSPRIGVLLGGPTRAVPLTPEDWQAISARLRHWQRAAGGSVLLCASRRTPDWLRVAARQSLTDLPGMRWLSEADGGNPYAGVLAWSERLVVTADSVNLLSEACATGVPVLSRLPAAPRGRIAAFHRALLAGGYLQELDAEPISAAVTALRELDQVVAEVRARLSVAR